MATIRQLAQAAVPTIALLCGCTHTRSVYLGNGHQGYNVSCRGLTRTWASCLARAGRLCGSRGYRVAYGDEIEGELQIECRPVDR